MPVDYSAFSVLLIALVLAVGFVFGTMFLIRQWMSWRLPRPEKSAIYECGEDTMGSAWLRFNIRFYMVAIVFLLFEVELVLTLPLLLLLRGTLNVAVDKSAAIAAVFVMAEVMVFVGVLLLGLFFVWACGDLSWVRDTLRGDKPVKRDLMPKRDQ
jgi:NADH-quinone oxidoreductase subunit A